ncbi:chaplin family protein [Streptomyces zagrosensis]|uniref:Chaplin domain-containing protein n=1 Tax=Streptomyces zagrosensis TaxID=1042984 RepID=A0A7W9QHJ5_9ACTN|nr:chaplin family protein [Streptomyces zagrosensis]MBB5940375.1 hypothetical protein [Streptomyces zagrosensis]
MAHAKGATTSGAGAGSNNLAGLPITSPYNHCGGAELVDANGFEAIPILTNLSPPAAADETD